MPKGLWLMTWRCLRMGSFDSGPRPALSGVSALIRHCTIHVLSGLDARKQLWPLRDHWADNPRGRSAPTPSLVCHFVLDAPLSTSTQATCHVLKTTVTLSAANGSPREALGSAAVALSPAPFRRDFALRTTASPGILSRQSRRD